MLTCAGGGQACGPAPDVLHAARVDHWHDPGGARCHRRLRGARVEHTLAVSMVQCGRTNGLCFVVSALHHRRWWRRSAAGVRCSRTSSSRIYGSARSVKELGATALGQWLTIRVHFDGTDDQILTLTDVVGTVLIIIGVVLSTVVNEPDDQMSLLELEKQFFQLGFLIYLAVMVRLEAWRLWRHAESSDTNWRNCRRRCWVASSARLRPFLACRAP